jgi:energy-coupling factor transport system permease protein
MDQSKISFGLNYIETGSFIHRLSGVTKFILFIFWISVVLTNFDLRILMGMLLLGFLLIGFSRIPFRIYRPFLFFMIYILFMNSLFMFLFAPMQGVEYMGSRTDLFVITGRYTVTRETLFYLLVIGVKHFSIFPIALLFVFTTHPTEFASSMNRIGIPYKVAYSVSLTLRYLPEITKDFVNIMQSQQARGVDISRKVPLKQRIRNVTRVLIPLLLSSLEKAEVISNAMSLRGFGKGKRRTWYNSRPLAMRDYLTFAGMVLFLIFVVYMKSRVPDMFWYPF